MTQPFWKYRILGGGNATKMAFFRGLSPTTKLPSQNCLSARGSPFYPHDMCYIPPLRELHHHGTKTGLLIPSLGCNILLLDVVRNFKSLFLIICFNLMTHFHWHLIEQVSGYKISFLLRRFIRNGKITNYKIALIVLVNRCRFANKSKILASGLYVQEGEPTLKSAVEARIVLSLELNGS